MNEMKERNNPQRNDILTIVAVSIIAFALSSLIHEGFGHGGVCLAVGCQPLYLSSMNFDGNETMLSEAAIRFISAGGTLANLFVGLAALAAIRSMRRFSPSTRYFVWLLATINLLQATGYFLFSGIGNFGDWARVIQGLEPSWLWRVILAVAGGVSYLYCVRLALIYLGAFIGGDRTRRIKRAQVLMLVPYFTGASLGLLAGLFNPAGIGLIIFSALPATLGGTSGLAWGSQLLHGEGIQPADETPLTISRSWIWIVSAIIIGAIFIIVLGKGVKLGISQQESLLFHRISQKCFRGKDLSQFLSSCKTACLKG